MLCTDPAGPEGSVRRGHHHHPQTEEEEEEGPEETAVARLPSLLPNHMTLSGGRLEDGCVGQSTGLPTLMAGLVRG